MPGKPRPAQTRCEAAWQPAAAESGARSGSRRLGSSRSGAVRGCMYSELLLAPVRYASKT